MVADTRHELKTTCSCWHSFHPIRVRPIEQLLPTRSLLDRRCASVASMGPLQGRSARTCAPRARLRRGGRGKRTASPKSSASRCRSITIVPDTSGNQLLSCQRKPQASSDWRLTGQKLLSRARRLKQTPRFALRSGNAAAGVVQFVQYGCGHCWTRHMLGPVLNWRHWVSPDCHIPRQSAAVE